MLQLITNAWRLVYARYLLASALSLGVDLQCFNLLLNLAVPPVGAATVGYGAGLYVHWLVSSRLVFATAPNAAPGLQRKTLFAISALAGLAITALIVAMFDRFGLDARWGKAVAILASFHAVYLIRKSYVFQ